MIRIILKRLKTKNIIKAFIKYIFDHHFKVNCLIDKLILTKSEIKRSFISWKISRISSCHISRNIKIGKNFIMPHPVGVVLGTITIGDNVMIYQNVTIGMKDGKYPTIGNNVVIYSGAVIVGDVYIGDNSIVGANAVVTHSFAENSVIGGIPAKTLKVKQNENC